MVPAKTDAQVDQSQSNIWYLHLLNHPTVCIIAVLHRCPRVKNHRLRQLSKLVAQVVINYSNQLRLWVVPCCFNLSIVLDDDTFDLTVFRIAEDFICCQIIKGSDNNLNLRRLGDVMTYPFCLGGIFVVAVFVKAKQIRSIAQTCLQCNILSKLK